MARIFVSHSSRDAEQATRLLEWLRAQGFEQTFLDIDKHGGIAPGTAWEKKLYAELAGAEAVLLILTRNWFDSKWCFVEFAQARALGKAIFPLVETPKGDTYIAADIQNLDLTLDRDGGLDRLGAELRRIALDAQAQFPWDVTRSPFPGLQAFDETDAAVYFGRDDDIRRLMERLNARRSQGGAPLLLLLGASGSGKSSLIRAGVLPRLKRDRRNWIVLPPFRPQIRPIDELAQAVALGLGKAGEWRTWRDNLSSLDPSGALSDLARDLRATQGSNEAQILVTIDQGEELFGTADKAEAARFLHLLQGMGDERLPFLVLMGLRSDHLDHLQHAEELTVPFEEFSLKPMPIDRVRQIIEGPARVAGLTVEDGLITAAIKDAATDDALPLLAFALRELYDHSNVRRHLTLADYRALGDAGQNLSPLENVVRRRADEVIGAAKPRPEDLAALKDAFVPAMVRINSEGEYVRRPAKLDDLPENARPLLKRLEQARLLVTRQEGGVAFVEVAHEALLRKWPLLRGWIDEEREFLIGKEQLKQDLSDWTQAGPDQKTDALLSGLKLTRAALWLAARPKQLSEAEQKFIQASIDRQTEERERREKVRRTIQIGSIAAAVILAFVAAIALWQRTVATSALAEAESNYQLALKQAAGSVDLLTKSFKDGSISNRLMQQLVEISQQTLNELPGETDDVTVARARLFNVLSTAHLVLGNVGSARKFVDAELALATKLNAKDPDNQQWLKLNETAHGQLSGVLYWSGDAASGALDEAMTAKNIAVRLTKMAPDSDEFQRDLFDHDRGIGDALSDIGRLDEANAAYEEMRKIAVERSARHPDNAEWKAAIADAVRELGDVLTQQYRWADAAAKYRDALAIMAELVQTDPGNVGYLDSATAIRERLGDSLLGQDDAPGALAAYQQAMRDAKSLFNADPTNLRWRELLETTHQRVGDAYMKTRDYAHAREEFQIYLTLAEETLPVSKGNGGALYDVANARLKLGDLFREQEDFDSAREQYSKSLSIAEELNRMKWNGSWSKILAMNHQRIGMILRSQDKKQDALKAFDQCAGVKVNKFAWSPRAIWPPDVTAFCQGQIMEMKTVPPR